jgi:Ca2+-transporting ATPase
VILLLIATLVSFGVWLLERDAALPFEAIAIFVIVLLNAIVGYVQEARAEESVAALMAMTAPEAGVLRDGEQGRVPAAELVPGDILLLEEGDTIPADGRLIEASALQIAEAALTGESLPVIKDTAPLEGAAGIGDRSNMVFSSSAVTQGRGRAIVTATGMQTEVGQIADLLQSTEDEETPLAQEINRVALLLGRAVIVIAIVIVGTILLFEDVNSLQVFVDVLVLGVSLAVAAVPEGLSTILTVVLALGTQRMARRNAIVRKLAAVETLGSATVICSDKTGTLTRNEMTVRNIITASGQVELTGIGYEPDGQVLLDGRLLQDGPLHNEVSKTLRAAGLANNAVLREEDGQWSIGGDPTEGALIVAACKAGIAADTVAERFERIGEVPFSSDRKLMSTAHSDAEKPERRIVFAKGAPDVLLARCTHERVGEEAQALTDERREQIQATINEMAAQALRTLGIAFRTLPDEDAIETNEGLEQEFVFLGLVGMIDPPREEAREAVRVARRAGIRPVMITGDHPLTAAAIAGEVGVAETSARAVSGAELQRHDDESLRELVREVSVYARVSPEHKLRIVRALRANGDVVAMTGDGVNDAPALKTADIGVAMGITGTDVSKEASDMVLADDNYRSIVAAVEEGRSIFANIRKFLRYLLSSNIGEVLTMFFGVVMASVIGLVAGEGEALVLPLLATQILWINLATDAAPALAVGVDPADADVMSDPPRKPGTPVIDRQMWFGIFFVGIVMAAGTLLMLDYGLPGGLIAGSGDIDYARTMAFTTLVFFQLFNVLNARSDTASAFHKLFTNQWLWLALLFSTALQVVVVYTPALQSAFGTMALSPLDWLLCIAVASSVLWLREIGKLGARLLGNDKPATAQEARRAPGI